MSTQRRIPLSSLSPNKKVRLDDDDDTPKSFGDLPPFVSLEKIFKAHSPPADGKLSLLFDIKDHVYYSQHNVATDVYHNYGEAMNEGMMWHSILRKDTTPRVTTGFSRSRYRCFATANSIPLQGLYQGLSIHGECVNTWATQYDKYIGRLGLHCDDYKNLQVFRSIFTQGTSPDGGKYIRFQECGDDGRWVELWTPHASLYTLTKHGSGADRPRDEHGNCISTETEKDKGERYLQHAIFQGQLTHASFFESRPKPGFTNQQVLLGLHSALPPSKVVECYENPPYPTKEQIGQAPCLKMSAEEKAKLASFVHWGTWPLESSDDAQIEYEKDGICGKFHHDAPSDMLDSQVYCSFCDCIVNASKNYGKN